MSQQPATLEEQLAARFAPILVLHPEYRADQETDDDPADDPPHDYHPRDIRLVLSKASRRLAIQGTGFRGWLPALARQWPKQILWLTSVLAAGWVYLLIHALKEDSSAIFGTVNGDTEFRTWWPWGLAFTSLFLFASGFAAFQVSWRHWLAPAVLTPAAFALAMVLAFQLSDPALAQLIGSIIVGFLSFAFSLLWQYRGSRPNPERLLASLSHLALPKDRADLLTRSWLRLTHYVRKVPEQAYLLYAGAGPPPDRDGHRRAYIEALRAANAADDQYPPTAYARVVRGENYYEGFVAIQYWMAYFYNDWANTHEMDWEQVTVYASFPAVETDCNVAKPVACAFSQHHGGTIVRWANLWPPEDADHRSDRPLVFVAHGSHANYSRPGRRRPAMPFAGLRFTGKDLGLLLGKNPESYVDKTLSPATESRVEPSIIMLPNEPGIGEIWGHDCPAGSCKADTHEICERDFRWLNLRGKWGSPGGFFGDAAPQSPPDQGSWRPFDWLEDCQQFERSIGETFLLARR